MKNVYMEAAIRAAQDAANCGEIPVGAAIFRGRELIASAGNRTESDHDATAHAETLAIRMAGRRLGDWRLDGCRIYVTLEPCPLCASAIQLARLDSVTFGAFNRQNGAAGTRFDLFQSRLFGRSVTVYGGICEAECEALLQSFFASRRAAENPPRD